VQSALRVPRPEQHSASNGFSDHSAAKERGQTLIRLPPYSGRQDPKLQSKLRDLSLEEGVSPCNHRGYSGQSGWCDRNESGGYEGRARQVHSSSKDERCSSRDGVDTLQQRSRSGLDYADEQWLTELKNALSRKYFYSCIGNSVWSRLIVNGGFAHLFDLDNSQ